MRKNIICYGSRDCRSILHQGSDCIFDEQFNKYNFVSYWVGNTNFINSPSYIVRSFYVMYSTYREEKRFSLKISCLQYTRIFQLCKELKHARILRTLNIYI